MNVVFVLYLIVICDGIFAKIDENKTEPLELRTNGISEHFKTTLESYENATWQLSTSFGTNKDVITYRSTVDSQKFEEVENVTETSTSVSTNLYGSVESQSPEALKLSTVYLTESSIKNAETEEFSSTSSPSTTLVTEEPCPDNATVTNLQLSIQSFNVTLQWESFNNTQCPQNYEVYLNGKSYQNTTDTQLVIRNLKACEEYTVGVAMFDGIQTWESVIETFSTIVPKPFSYRVSNIEFEEIEDTLSVTWTAPPDSVVKCVTTYDLQWWDNEDTDNRGEKNISVPETTTNLSLVGCMNYAVMITPKVSEAIVGINLNKDYTVTPIPTNTPSIFYNSLKSDKTSFNITWNVDDQKKNKCKLLKIVINCEAKDEDYPRNVTNKEAILNITEVTADFRFPMTVNEISPFTNYSCSGFVINSGGNSPSKQFNVKTAEDIPPAPEMLQTANVSTHEFTVEWTKPINIPGILKSYTLQINNEGPNFSPSDNCPSDKKYFMFEDIDPEKNSYKFEDAYPDYSYVISIFGVDGAGNGITATTLVTTKAAKPDNVRNPQLSPITYSENEIYSAYATLSFERACTYGPFKYYQISYRGERKDFPNDERIVNFTDTKTDINLQPDRLYSFNVSVITQESSSVVGLDDIRTKSGVPSLGITLIPPSVNDTNKAYLKLSKEAFNDSNGEVLYYSLILLPRFENLTIDYGFWDGTEETWPIFDPSQSHQLTKKFWNPFEDGVEEIVFVIGKKDNYCTQDDYCKPLRDGTKYSLIVRALTNAAYKDSLLNFKTYVIEQINLGLILGLTFGILIALILIVIAIFLWRRKKKALIEKEERFSVSSPNALSCKQFKEYYETIRDNYNIIKTQYSNLGCLSKEFPVTTSYALLPENRRKNRYTNILPYDETRVKLKIDEDDEISSDYINASYVRGFSNKIEYIATQGPLESTCKDFWKMIIQENVGIIVMVSQFIEQSKEKCFQYFPNNHEKLSFGESLEVRCSTELHFGTYCIRTLQVRKDNEQRSVIHMQFLEWPDFGVPQNTNNMLEFCHQMREKAKIDGELIVVHCSAGVGRTGTLIAMDIILQTIDHHREINIYKTVLDLRRQRINMVQTEKQYMFIHTCVKEYLETPIIQTSEQFGDRVYENMDIIKSSLKKNLLEDTEVESAL